MVESVNDPGSGFPAAELVFQGFLQSGPTDKRGICRLQDDFTTFSAFAHGSILLSKIRIALPWGNAG